MICTPSPSLPSLTLPLSHANPFQNTLLSHYIQRVRERGRRGEGVGWGVGHISLSLTLLQKNLYLGTSSSSPCTSPAPCPNDSPGSSNNSHSPFPLFPHSLRPLSHPGLPVPARFPFTTKHDRFLTMSPCR